MRVRVAEGRTLVGMTHIHGAYLLDHNLIIPLRRLFHIERPPPFDRALACCLPRTCSISNDRTCAGPQTMAKMVWMIPRRDSWSLSSSSSSLPLYLCAASPLHHGQPLWYPHAPTTRTRAKQSIPQTSVVSTRENKPPSHPVRSIRFIRSLCRMFHQPFTPCQLRSSARRIPGLT